MGMNIYKLKKDGGEHIGKRWAAGIWCWDCKVRCFVESDEVPFFKSLEACPKCGKPVTKGNGFNPAMRELGFDKTREHNHVGIDGASGFNWHAKDKRDALRKLRGIKKVRTEYGDYWSIKRFWRMFNDIIIENYSNYEFS